MFMFWAINENIKFNLIYQNANADPATAFHSCMHPFKISMFFINENIKFNILFIKTQMQTQ
jgi:hypothetical protein